MKTSPLLLAMTVLLSACVVETVMETPDFKLLQVRQNPKPSSIEISLLWPMPLDVSLVPYKVETQEEGDTLRVLVHSRGNEWGKQTIPNNYTFNIPDDINLVTFGKNRRVIWKRSTHKNEGCYQLHMQGAMMERMERCDPAERIDLPKEEGKQPVSKTPE